MVSNQNRPPQEPSSDQAAIWDRRRDLGFNKHLNSVENRSHGADWVPIEGACFDCRTPLGGRLRLTHQRRPDRIPKHGNRATNTGLSWFRN